MKETVRAMLRVKYKMLEGTITRDEMNNELLTLTKSLSSTPNNLFNRIKKSLDDFITPKIVILSIAVILAMSAVLIKPDMVIEVLSGIKKLNKK